MCVATDLQDSGEVNVVTHLIPCDGWTNLPSEDLGSIQEATW